MNTMKDLRNALYELVDGIDVTDVIPEWGMKSAFPPKQALYPGFWIEPVSNSTLSKDSCSNESTFTFAISIVASYEDAMGGEDEAIDLSDLVYRAVLTAAKTDAIDVDGFFDGTPSGQWGFDERYGQRVYRIDVAFRVAEPLDP